VLAGTAVEEINDALKKSNFPKEILTKEIILNSIILTNIWKEKIFTVNPQLMFAVEGLGNKD